MKEKVVSHAPASPPSQVEDSSKLRRIRRSLGVGGLSTSSLLFLKDQTRQFFPVFQHFAVRIVSVSATRIGNNEEAYFFELLFLQATSEPRRALPLAPPKLPIDCQPDKCNDLRLKTAYLVSQHRSPSIVILPLQFRARSSRTFGNIRQSYTEFGEAGILFVAQTVGCDRRIVEQAPEPIVDPGKVMSEFRRP